MFINAINIFFTVTDIDNKETYTEVYIQRNMEVKGMYIESMSSQASGINATVNTQTAAPVSTARPVTKTGTDNTVRVEATDGESAQKPESLSEGVSVNLNDSEGGYKAKDARTAEEKKTAENERIRKAVERMNVQLPNSEVKFGIHEKTDRVTIKLIDKETKEVIKEFPPEKTLDMIAKCMEIAGVLMDEKL